MARKIDKEILRLAWPAIATNITTPLLSLVDVAIVGHIGSAAYIGAVTVGGAMLNMLYWLFGFLRAGTSGITAQAVGAGDRQGQMLALARSLGSAAIIGILIIALSSPLGELVLNFMDAQADTASLARRYFSVAVWGAPGLLGTYALSGWFLGMQSSRPAMWMSIIANSANIVLSTTFVFALGMGIEGVGLGTAIAQWISLTVGVAMLPRYCHGAPKGWSAMLLQWAGLKRLFAVNADIMLRTLCLIAVTLWFTHAGAVLGDSVLAANALLMQLFMLFSYFMDGFAYAGEALAGKFAGGHDATSLRTLVRTLMRWGTALSLIASLLYFTCGEWFLSLLTADANVLDVAAEYKLWAVAVPLAGFMSFIWDGIYIGLVKTRLMLLTMAVSMVIFYAIYFLAHPYLGNNGLWLAFIAYLATRGLLQSALYSRLLHHL